MRKRAKPVILKRIVLPLLVAGGMAINAFSQTHSNKKDHSELRRMQESFIEMRTDVAFPNLDTLKTLNGPQFYFGRINRPTMVYFGFEGCPPCRFELPLLVKTANMPKYQGYNFVYLTYDDSATIYDELKNQKAEDLVKIKLTTIPKPLIDDNKLTFGYPTKYFISSGGITKKVETGGYTSDSVAFLMEWYPALVGLR